LANNFEYIKYFEKTFIITKDDGYVSTFVRTRQDK